MICILFSIFVCMVKCVEGAWPVKRLTLFSRPFTMDAGEVHNRVDIAELPSHIVKSFKNKHIPLKSITCDAVYARNKTAIPLSDVYLHHCKFSMVGEVVELEKMSMKQLTELYRNYSIGFDAEVGAGSRGASIHLVQPYGAPVFSPKFYHGQTHLINTRKKDINRRLAECPCTQEMLNSKAGTDSFPLINNQHVPPFSCGVLEGNTACSLRTYIGGLRCCEDGWNLLEPEEKADVDDLKVDVAVRVRLEYWDIPDEGNFIPVIQRFPGSIGHWWVDFHKRGDHRFHHNVEYDVPQCKQGDECVFTIKSTSSVSLTMLDAAPANITSFAEKRDWISSNPTIKVAHLWGHLHIGGIDMSIYRGNEVDEEKLLCRNTAVYGNSTEAGNEEGYLVTYRTMSNIAGTVTELGGCAWHSEDAPVLAMLENVTLVARYNNTEPHTGVMAVFFAVMAPADDRLIPVNGSSSPWFYPDVTLSI